MQLTKGFDQNTHLSPGVSVHLHPLGLLWFDGYYYLITPLSLEDFASKQKMKEVDIDPIHHALRTYYLNILFQNGWISHQSDQHASCLSLADIELQTKTKLQLFVGTETTDYKAGQSKIAYVGYRNPFVVGDFEQPRDIGWFLEDRLGKNLVQSTPVMSNCTKPLVDRNLDTLALIEEALDEDNEATQCIRSIVSIGEGEFVVNNLLGRKPEESQGMLMAKTDITSFRLTESTLPLNLGGNGYGFQRTNLNNAYLDSLCHPVFGPVRHVEKLDSDIDQEASALTHNYSADHHFIGGTEHVSRKSSFSVSGGKGCTDRDARNSAIGEAVERLSGIGEGVKPCQISSFKTLDGLGIHPNSIALYSTKQYQDRDKINEIDNPYEFVPHEFDETSKVWWTKVVNIRSLEPAFALFEQVYYSGADTIGRRYARADSNGCAAGWNYSEAILQGLLELVERDAVAIWWYNCVKAPLVDLEAVDDPYVQGLRDGLRKSNRDFWLLDISTDLDVPCFAALSAKDGREIAIGFGCHLDGTVALRRAVMEMSQFFPVLAGKGYSRIENPQVRNWFQTKSLKNDDFLKGVGKGGRVIEGFNDQSTVSVLDSLVDRLFGNGLSVFVLDQTLPSSRLKVTRTIVPGLRHFWRRLAPGRLFDVPVKMDWRDFHIAETSMNNETVFF